MYSFFITLVAIAAIIPLGRGLWLEHHDPKYRAWLAASRRRPSQGFSLLELCIVMLVITVLLTIALPNPAAVTRFFNDKNARTQVQMVANASAALAVCNANHQTCAGLAPLIPADGTQTIGSYTFIMVGDSTWYSYTATPLDPQNRAFYVDSTNLLRCQSGMADSSSPLCN